MRATRSIIVALALGWVVPDAAPASADPEWWSPEAGLELQRFDSQERRPARDGDLIVLRIDPVRCRLRALQAGDGTGGEGLRLSEWAERFDLLAAINAGMYQADRRTHVGFAQINGVVVNRGVNDYQSAVAFDPVDAADDPFGVFDLDVTPLPDLRRRYRTVLQNLRLVKRAGENRWQPLGSRWAEAALGEDANGRVLLIHCRSAWSMHDFIEILLDLPLDLVAAQHLEGRSQARLWIADELEVHSNWNQGAGPILPNVIGVQRRPEPE